MKKALYLLLVCSYLSGCDKDSEPHYPAEPFIEFKSLEFIDVADTKTDAINLTFSYRDGDGDLGLSYDEIDSPYHKFDLFLEDGKNLIKIGTKPLEGESYDYVLSNWHFTWIMFLDFKQNQTGELVTIRTKEKESFDFLPKDSCRNYLYPSTALLVYEKDKKFIGDAHILDTFVLGNEKILILADTFYHQINEFHYNIMNDFLVEQADGSFAEFDWYQNFCATFDSRFPKIPFVEDGPFKAKSISRWEGEITYTMRSRGFAYLFGGKKIKLNVTIKDRALNQSNIIETNVIEIPTN